MIVESMGSAGGPGTMLEGKEVPDRRSAEAAALRGADRVPDERVAEYAGW